MSNTAKPLTAEILQDLTALHSQTSAGKWTKGTSTHHTVAKQEGKEDYHIADFHHASDAAFVDVAHAYLPRLVQEVTRLTGELERLQSAVLNVQKSAAWPFTSSVIRGLLGDALAQTSAPPPAEQGTLTPNEQMENLRSGLLYERQEKEWYFQLYLQVCETAQQRLVEIARLDGKVAQAHSAKAAVPLSRSKALALATQNFPFWEQDIQEAFVLQLVSAVETAHGITRPTTANLENPK